MPSLDPAEPATASWTVDTIAPETSIANAQAAATRSRTAAFEFGGDALGGTALAGFECRLDDAAFAPCAAGGIDYEDLDVGEHRFEVRARDAAGKADATPAGRTWTIDLSAPATAFLETPAEETTETAATIAFRSEDAAGNVEDPPGRGDDVLLGGAGIDRLRGGPGADIVRQGPRR